MPEEAHSAANGSDPSEPDRVRGAVEPAGGVRHLPVPSARPRPLQPATAPLPAPVVAATGGFLAGVATFVVVRLLRGRRSSRGIGRLRGRDRGIEVTGTRSFLVDVHLLKR